MSLVQIQPLEPIFRSVVKWYRARPGTERSLVRVQPFRPFVSMLGIAQLVERKTVNLVVVGSNPIIQPKISVRENRIQK